MTHLVLMTPEVIAFRLGLSFIAGAIIGFERASHHQVAGLRTHILISVGATLLMLLSIWVPEKLFGSTANGDPGRIAAQVVSGIGFLGAGAIIRLGTNVRGLTTAASLWFMAAVGLAIGAGFYWGAAIAEVVGFVSLFFLGKVERRFFPAERLKFLNIIYKTNAPDTASAVKIVKQAGIRIQSMDVVESTKSKRTKLKMLLAVPSTSDIADVARDIKGAGKDVGKVEITEKY
jgi:putative Mg2+ transporter-C (MgtC) family protein